MSLEPLQLDTIPDELATLGRVLAAMVLGAAIGFEREAANRPAGLRTHMLVSGAAALLTALGLGLIESYEVSLRSAELLRADPIRIVEAIVTGIAFLGAGTIIRSNENHVTGLTTAASLLISAAIGISVALSLWVLAAGVVLLAVVTLYCLHWLESRFTIPERDHEPDPPERDSNDTDN